MRLTRAGGIYKGEKPMEAGEKKKKEQPSADNCPEGEGGQDLHQEKKRELGGNVISSTRGGN